MDLSLVVPCYNEEESVPVIYKEVKKTLNELEQTGRIKTWEYIFVDDGSRDKTLGVLRNFADQDDHVHYVSFSRNFGKEAALLAGLQAARGEYIVTLDADGQDPPSLVPEMLEAVASGEYDCVATRRVNRTGEPPVRSFFARRFYALMKKISDVDIVSGARDFRLMSRKYLEAFLALQEQNRFSKGLFPWIGFRIKWLEYENIERAAGRTKWSFWKLFLYSLDGIIAFTSKPLAIASVTGVLLFMASAALIVFIIIRRLVWGDPVDGWASTICIILFSSGIQLFSVGLLGQYVARIYSEVKNRPHFLIRESR